MPEPSFVQPPDIRDHREMFFGECEKICAYELKYKKVWEKSRRNTLGLKFIIKGNW